MQRVTQKMVDYAISRLAEKTKIKLQTNNCSGYTQLGFARENGGISMIDATYGDSKRDLYYQIQFCLQIIEEMEKNV